MELNLHPIATKCFVSGRDFQENDRVVSYLVREATGEVARRDLLAAEDGRFMPPAFVYCRWVVAFKNRKATENPALTLRLTAENLFLTLADPAAEPSAANTPLLQFLALMLERKKLLKPRGLTEDGARQIFEHMPSHQLYEVPVGELDVEFFQKIQEHLHVLVGGPKTAAPPAPAPSPAGVVTG
ncbi:MAG TPA: hypothetical protein VHD61_16125 [Lacunisphaera sp.]|nr:hypothetical protein [Lacunisphaera sp.]